MPTQSQSKLTPSPLHLAFDPHLLLDLEFTTKDNIALLNHDAENSDVRFVYNGKSCQFRCHILNGDKAITGNKLQMAIELVNPTVHYGHFNTGKEVELAVSGNTIAHGKVAEVLDDNFTYWSSRDLPEPLKNKKPLLSKEPIKDFLLNLEFDLITLNYIEDYTISIDGSDNNFITIELAVPNKTLTLLQAKRLEKIFKEQGFGECFYKADYVPFSYGLLDILMQNYTATFATANKKKYITGIVKIV